MKNLLLLWTLTIIQGLPAPYYRVLVLPYNVPPPVHLNTSEFETYNLPPTRTPKQIIETRFVNFSFCFQSKMKNSSIFNDFLRTKCFKIPTFLEITFTMYYVQVNVFWLLLQFSFVVFDN